MEQLFSNREIATVIWLFIFLSWAFTIKEVRNITKQLLLTFCRPRILALFVFMGGYIYLVVDVLFSIGLWKFDQLKNTILWFIFVASVELFKANTIHNDEGYFRNSIKDHFKILALFEFIVAFQSFSLVAEIFIIPITSIVVLILSYSELKEEYKPVKKLLSLILTIFGVFLVSYSLYFIFINFGKFAQYQTLMDFITPIILSILILPFIFLISIYMLYESILVRINIYTNDKFYRGYAKLKALIYFKRDHKSLDKWLSYSCSSDFESMKAIDDSIISFHARKSETL